MDDTLTFTVDGYETYTTAVHTTGYLTVTLRMNTFSAEENGRRLVSQVQYPGGVRDLGGVRSLGFVQGLGAVRGSAVVRGRRDSGVAGGRVLSAGSGGRDSGGGVRSDGGVAGQRAGVRGRKDSGSAGQGVRMAGRKDSGSAPFVAGAGMRVGGTGDATGSAGGGGGAGHSSRVENAFVPQVATVSFTGSGGRASYNTIRRFLDMGTAVPPDAVKIEEMLNYFNFSYDEPGGRDVFHCASQVLTCPWNGAHRLVALRVCARKVDIHSKPPCNLVLLVDCSGSMDMPNKLPLVKTGIRLLVDNLRDIDTISVVEFGRQVRVVFAGMAGLEKQRILRALEGLRADGPSPGLQGLRLAYDVARQQFIAGGNNRVILVTDGDVSMDPPNGEQDLEELIDKQAQGGIRLTCGGLGMKSVKDSKLASLAEIGRGDFAYLDDEQTAEQLFSQELDPGLACVAENVSVTADFSPALVASYRLLGYDNKRSVMQDTTAGLGGARVGSGGSLMALFEIVPKADTTGADTLVRVRVNYCLPGQVSVKTMGTDCMNDVGVFDRVDPEWRKAVCMAIFGMKLQRSAYVSGVQWVDIEKMAKRLFTGSNYLDDDYISLIDRAKRIYDRRGND
jgi:Ca-activated chloride channel homolog